MFEGTGVALVTPFTKDNAVDYTALGNIIDNVINGGVQFLVALGTTGETPTLTKAEKKQILNFVLDYNKGRVPVVVGIGENNTQALLDTLAEYPMDRVQPNPFAQQKPSGFGYVVEDWWELIYLQNAVLMLFQKLIIALK